MRKPKHSEEEIIATGKRLQDEGKEVTPNAIKNILGSGKASRIADIWNAFLNENEAANPKESLLKKTPDPDKDRFAMDVSWPIQDAATSVERVFEKLLADVSEKAERRLENLLDREEARHRNAEAELQGQLRSTERMFELKEEERYDLSQRLTAAQQKIKNLEASIESMKKQIDEHKEIKTP
ncbi:hypothetical protein C9993_10605 [Marinobacter sp. Z-F4-2]|nr:hypothetical protein C9993_10605 [Marinobacter sp. Z-F4-2]